MTLFNKSNPNAVQGAGVSGSRVGINIERCHTMPGVLECEMALSQIGNFEPLDWKIDVLGLEGVINQKYSNDWVDYLPRSDRPNNRKSMTLTTIEGWDHTIAPSIPEAANKLGRIPDEKEFCNPTQLYLDCDIPPPGGLISLKGFLDEFTPLGRSFIINSSIGGYFVPHRDHPGMPRPCFRLVAFLKNCGPMEYDWLLGADQKLNIELGRVYYVNTRMTHRTMSWVNDSWHLILNVPFTVANVDKVLKHLQHRH